MKSSLVIDNSALLAVLLNEATRPAMISATKGCTLVGAPSLPWEIGNALIAAFRRRRLPSVAVQRAWSSYQTIPVRLAEIDVASALQIAMEVGLYAYDAFVLESARAERLPLLTLDRGLKRAAQQIGLQLLELNP